jgi:hypothetical protein
MQVISLQRRALVRASLAYYLPNLLMLSVARRAKAKQGQALIQRPSTSLRYAQDQQENTPQ